MQNFINHSRLHHVISFNAILLYTSDTIKIQSNSDVILTIRHIRQYAFIIVTLESLWAELEFIFMGLWYSKAYLFSRNKQFSLLYTKQPYIHIKHLFDFNNAKLKNNEKFMFINICKLRILWQFYLNTFYFTHDGGAFSVFQFWHLYTDKMCTFSITEF